MTGFEAVPGSATGSIRRSITTDAREDVEVALGFDRTAERMVWDAERQVSAARTGLTGRVDGRFGPEPMLAAQLLEQATGAQLFALGYQANCRDALAAALDALAAIMVAPANAAH